MKLLSIALPLLLGVLPSIAQAQEAEPVAESVQMVEVEAVFLRAGSEEMSSALTAAGVPAGLLTSAQFQQVLAALKAAGATVFGNPRAVSAMGQKAMISTVREFRYPVKYDQDKNNPDRRFPVSFDTRNLGVEFQFDALMEKDGRIGVVAEPSVTSLLGFIDYSDASSKPPKESNTDKLMKGELKEGGIWQPVFSSFKSSSRLILPSGQTALLGGVAEEVTTQGAVAGEAVKKIDERLIYVFVTARTVGSP